jgi:hypothetical protein
LESKEPADAEVCVVGLRLHGWMWVAEWYAAGWSIVAMPERDVWSCGDRMDWRKMEENRVAEGRKEKKKESPPKT